jgi:SAM-dependent methyltransferase
MMSLTIDNPAYFARLADVEAAHWWSVGMWRIASLWLDHALANRRGLSALDIGCGAGGTMRRLSTRSEITRVMGLDPSPSALEHVGDHTVVLGSALHLPFPDDSFDVATSFDVMQHLPPDGDCEAAAEMRRVLRPGGIAVIRANGRGLWPDPESTSQAYELSQLQDVFLSAGFRVRAATYANCLPAVAAEIAGRWQRPQGSTPSRLGNPSGRGLRIRPASVSRNRLMGAIANVEAWLVGRLGQRLPVGHGTMLLVQNNPATGPLGGRR